MSTIITGEESQLAAVTQTKHSPSLKTVHLQGRAPWILQNC